MCFTFAVKVEYLLPIPVSHFAFKEAPESRGFLLEWYKVFTEKFQRACNTHTISFIQRFNILTTDQKVGGLNPFGITGEQINVCSLYFQGFAMSYNLHFTSLLPIIIQPIMAKNT